MTGVLLEEAGEGGEEGGCNNFSKGRFLSRMGREVWLFSKVRELAFLLFFTSILLTYSHNTGHWIVIDKTPNYQSSC